MWSVRPATPGDWPHIAALLAAACLPLDGAQDHLDGFLVALSGDRLVGTAALERYGDAALLRSVAVAASERGAGLGQLLVGRALDQARDGGTRQVVLLTTTAERFFPRFGFAPVERDQAPAAVRVSAEFQGACPASAVVMLLDLPPA